MTVIIVVVVAGLWELYLRNNGRKVSYDDGPPLWSDKREMVYESPNEAVVFIGSSRIKYDLDIPTWNSITNVHAIQLAIEGSCPRPVLEDLANDPNFKGKLIIDVTEGLFFSNAPHNAENPNKNINYFHEQTPAQRASFIINKPLESMFVFLDKDHLSLNAQLDELELKSRPGVFMMPIFPMDFDRCTFDRKMYMTPAFVSDTIQRNKVKGIWQFFASMSKKAPPMPESELDAIFKSVKNATDKIKARGGQVLFVRTPSSGAYLQGENIVFPRDKYWNRLLNETKCPGIHFMDYPSIAHFDCPEFSHLQLKDAVTFTQEFIKIINTVNGWKITSSTQEKTN